MSTNDAQCPSCLIIKGRAYLCDVDAPHDGRSHANKSAESVWGYGPTVWGDDGPAEPLMVEGMTQLASDALGRAHRQGLDGYGAGVSVPMAIEALVYEIAALRKAIGGKS